MDKNIDRLLNPEWMKAIRQTELHLQRSALAIQKSELMGMANQFALQTHELAKTIERSGIMDISLKMSESLRNSLLPISNQLNIEHLSGLAAYTNSMTTLLQQSAFMKEVSNLKIDPLLEKLASLDNSPFANLPIDELMVSPLPKSLSEDMVEALEMLDKVVRSDVDKVDDYNTLPDSIKQQLIAFYDKYILPLLIAIIATVIVDEFKDWRSSLGNISTKQEVKVLTQKKHPSGIDREVLKGFRMTTTRLNLRETPEMKSEIITVLPVGTLMEVVDKTNRSWIQVQVEVDGELELGWVSRRYTAYFR